MTTDEILAGLEECKRRNITVFLDNDDVHAWDEDTDEYLLQDVLPYRLMEILLTHFGVQWEGV